MLLPMVRQIAGDLLPADTQAERDANDIATGFLMFGSKVYLTGLSMGGSGTWDTACHYPDRFAAIAPICGSGMPWRANYLNWPSPVWPTRRPPIMPRR